MSLTLDLRQDRVVTDTPNGPTLTGADHRVLHIDREHPHAAHNARFAALAAAWDWHLPPAAADDLVEIVDALLTNAIVHAKWPEDWPVVFVTISRSGPRIIIEVRDPDPTLPIWPTAKPMDIASLIDDPDIDPDDPILIHQYGLMDVAGRAALTAHVEAVGKVVRAELTIGGAL